MDQGATEVLAAHAVAGAPAATDHAAQVARALVDTVAVSLAGAGEPGERILKRWALGESPSGPSTVWTSGEKTTAAIAALINGTAGHLLDYDDICPSTPLHPSTVLLPAMVAAAEAWGGDAADSARFVEAYDVGAAAFRAVAEVLPQAVHYGAGWHSTSTVGRVATVAALARLAGLDVDTTRHALGIVSSVSGGSLANFGSMTKPFHAGAAARDAVMAVELARDGFTANPEELEAATGYFSRFGDPSQGPPGALAETLGERLEYWTDAWDQEWGFKQYPSCYGTHRGIDAMMELSRDAPADLPVAVRATLHLRGTRPLRKSAPTTATEAKFSLEYTMAVAYLRGKVGLLDFTDAAFGDAEVHDLMGRATVTEAEVPPVGPEEYTYGFTVVEVDYPDGTTRHSRVEVTHGTALDPLTDAELRAKAEDCLAAGGYAPELAGELIAAIQAEPGPAFTSTIPRRD